MPKFSSLNVVASKRFLPAASLRQEKIGTMKRQKRAKFIQEKFTHPNTFVENSAAEYAGRMLPRKGEGERF